MQNSEFEILCDLISKLGELRSRHKRQDLSSQIIKDFNSGRDNLDLLAAKLGNKYDQLEAIREELSCVLAPYDEKFRQTVKMLERMEDEQSAVMHRSLAQYGWSKKECHLVARKHLSQTELGIICDKQKEMLRKIRSGELTVVTTNAEQRRQSQSGTKEFLVRYLCDSEFSEAVYEEFIRIFS